MAALKGGSSKRNWRRRSKRSAVQCQAVWATSAERMRKSAGPAYLGSLIASVVSAFVLALFLHEMHVQSLEIGLLVGSHVWLGFVATVQLTGALFTKQSMKLFAINTGYQLVCYLVMSAILTIWR